MTWLDRSGAWTPLNFLPLKPNKLIKRALEYARLRGKSEQPMGVFQKQQEWEQCYSQ